MAITRGLFPNLVRAGRAIRQIFLYEMANLPEEYSIIFDVGSSEGAYETEFLSSGFILPPKLGEGEPLTYDDPLPVAEVRYNHVKWALGFRVTREMVNDEKFGFINRLPKALARVMRYRPEVEAAAVFNNGFSAYSAGTWGTIPLGAGSTAVPVPYTAAGVTFDGQAIFSTHNLKRGGTFANRAAVDLSYSGLQTLLNIFESMVDESNLLIRAIPKWVVVPYQLKMRAAEILGSQYKPFTANNEINAAIQLYDLQPMVFHYLTSAVNWFLLAAKGEHGFKHFWRQQTLFEQADDFDTKSIKNSAEQRFSVGASDWRGAAGANP